jgi:hypothetical protein
MGGEDAAGGDGASGGAGESCADAEPARASPAASTTAVSRFIIGLRATRYANCTTDLRQLCEALRRAIRFESSIVMRRDETLPDGRLAAHVDWLETIDSAGFSSCRRDPRDS